MNLRLSLIFLPNRRSEFFAGDEGCEIGTRGKGRCYLVLDEREGGLGDDCDHNSAIFI